MPAQMRGRKNEGVSFSGEDNLLYFTLLILMLISFRSTSWAQLEITFSLGIPEPVKLMHKQIIIEEH